MCFPDTERRSPCPRPRLALCHRPAAQGRGLVPAGMGSVVIPQPGPRAPLSSAFGASVPRIFTWGQFLSLSHLAFAGYRWSELLVGLEKSGVRVFIAQKSFILLLLRKMNEQMLQEERGNSPHSQLLPVTQTLGPRGWGHSWSQPLPAHSSGAQRRFPSGDAWASSSLRSCTGQSALSRQPLRCRRSPSDAPGL